MASLSVGQDVKATAVCKMSLYHTIMVMEETNQRKYSVTLVKQLTPFVTLLVLKKDQPQQQEEKRTVSKPVSELWKEALESSTKRSRAYSIREVFEVGDIVDHVKFGTGIVQALMDGDKIEVMFQNDIKTLVHSK